MCVCMLCVYSILYIMYHISFFMYVHTSIHVYCMYLSCVPQGKGYQFGKVMTCYEVDKPKLKLKLDYLGNIMRHFTKCIVISEVL